MYEHKFKKGHCNINLDHIDSDSERTVDSNSNGEAMQRIRTLTIWAKISGAGNEPNSAMQWPFLKSLYMNKLQPGWIRVVWVSTL